MAIPKVSKIITGYQKLCEFVEEFVKIHRQDLAEALTANFPQHVHEGEDPPNVLAFVNGLLGSLRAALDHLIAAERKHLDELANDAAYRQARDKALAELRAAVFDMRSHYTVALGEPEAGEVGFERETALQPLALLRQVQRILENLLDPELELPSSRYKKMVPMEPEAVVEVIKPPAVALRKAMDRLTREDGKVQGTQVAKNQAIETFNETYRMFVNILESSFRLAGKKDLAGRLRRTLPRRSSQSGEAPEAPPVPDVDVEEEADSDQSGG